MSYFVYVLKSQKDNKLYIGHTNDLETRLKAHNDRKVRSTKGRAPFIRVYFEELSTRPEAIERERYLKSGSGREFIKDKLGLYN